MIILPAQVTEAITVLENAGYDAYIVGSCVRELIMGNNPQDYDIITNAEINDILFAFREYRISDEGIQRGEILVTVVGMFISISPYRREVVGNRVMYTDSLEVDLSRRGFTIDAMAYCPRLGLVDLYGGKGCLAGEEKRVVAIGETITKTTKENGKPVTESYYDMSRSFTMEPSRILRAIRYCAEREFVIDDSTRAAMRQNVSCFEYADRAKVFAELSRIVMGKYATKVLDSYSDILKHVIPEMERCIGFEQHSKYHDFTVWEHICRSVGFAVPELPIRFAMLFHDIGKPDCCAIDSRGAGHFKGHGERSRLLAECVMRRLEFPRNLADEISWLVYHHDVKIPEDRKKLKELIRTLGAEDLKSLIQCEIADNRAKKTEVETEDVARLRASLAALNEIVTTGECWDISQLAVTKRELFDRRLVTSEQEAEELINVLFEIVLDKPSFNNKLMLLDMAQRSKQKLEELAAERAARQRELEEMKKQDRTNEPVFSKRKKKK
ncbi:MAG: CCA tRNA nucleotidyltransferase [Oscillospiraceae bacterium]|nr:CCA tRNA nucleotidyltransferase [Oscillospiraceae bacterium]